MRYFTATFLCSCPSTSIFSEPVSIVKPRFAIFPSLAPSGAPEILNTRVNSSSAHLSSIPNSLLSQFVEPWYESLRNPRETQERALQTLLAGYSKTEYGARFGASSTASVGDLVRVRLVSELGEPLHEWGPTCPARVGNLALYVEDGELQVLLPEFHHPLKAEVVRADHRSLPPFQQIPSQRACLLVGFDRPDERPV